MNTPRRIKDKGILTSSLPAISNMQEEAKATETKKREPKAESKKREPEEDK